MKKILTLVLAFAAFLSAFSAFAEEGKMGGHGHKMMKDWPCASDAKQFCADVKKTGHGEMMKCLDDHQDKLSAECKASREKMKASMQKFQEACKSDMESLCKSVDSNDHHAVHECLEKNEDKLSDKCKAQRAEMKKNWHDHKGKHSKMHSDDKKTE